MVGVIDRELASNDKATTGTQGNMIRNIIDSDLPESDKTDRRLMKESLSVILAGVETIANVLMALTYHVLAQPAIFDRLQREIGDAEGNVGRRLTLQELKDLPYLVSISSSEPDPPGRALLT